MTNHPPNGNEKSFKEQLKEFESILDNYLTSVGIQTFQYNNIVFDIIKLDLPDIQKLTTDECREYRYLLLQFALFVQKELNRNLVRKRWAESKLDTIIGKRYNNFASQYTKYEVVKNRVIAEDSSAAVLSNIVLHAESRVLELSGISDRVTELSKSLGDMAFRKNKNDS